jgi:hypothetical protein
MKQHSGLLQIRAISHQQQGGSTLALSTRKRGWSGVAWALHWSTSCMYRNCGAETEQERSDLDEVGMWSCLWPHDRLMKDAVERGHERRSWTGGRVNKRRSIPWSWIYSPYVWPDKCVHTLRDILLMRLERTRRHASSMQGKLNVDIVQCTKPFWVQLRHWCVCVSWSHEHRHRGEQKVQR